MGILEDARAEREREEELATLRSQRDALAARLEKLQLHFDAEKTASRELAEGLDSAVTRLAEVEAERDKALKERGQFETDAFFAKTHMESGLETIKMAQQFIAAMANEMRAAGCEFDKETCTVTNTRATAAESALAALRERVRGVRYVEGECEEVGSDPGSGVVRIIVATTPESIRSAPAMVYRPVRIMLAADVLAALEGEG
jgi:hypothetical protein